MSSDTPIELQTEHSFKEEDLHHTTTLNRAFSSNEVG